MESFGIGFGLVIGVWVIGFSVASIVAMFRGGGNIGD
jgi:hypothetical protein